MTTTPVATAPEMLVGKALLQFAKANKSIPSAQLARDAGYVKTNKAGRQLPDVSAFKTALLDASGLALVSGKATRSSAYETAVHQSGVLLIGYNYVREMKVGPGDVFQIIPGTDDDGEPELLLKLVERVEGSPLPAKLPRRKPKGAAAAAPAATEAPADADADPIDTEDEEGYEEDDDTEEGGEDEE